MDGMSTRTGYVSDAAIVVENGKKIMWHQIGVDDVGAGFDPAPVRNIGIFAVVNGCTYAQGRSYVRLANREAGAGQQEGCCRKGKYKSVHLLSRSSNV